MAFKKQDKQEEKEQTGLMVVDASKYALISSPDSSDVLAAIGDMGVKVWDLPKMRVPAGGQVAFEVTRMGNTEYLKERDVVILAVRGNQKAWHREHFEDVGGKPPDCFSTDGMTGMGNRSVDALVPDMGPHDCAKCPWGQFGSKRGKDGNREGKDCQDYALLLIATPEGRLPTVIKVPPSSLRAMKRYQMDLIDAGKKRENIVTRISLQKVDAVPPYSEMSFSFVGDIPAEYHAQTAVLRKTLEEALFAADPTKLG